MVDKNVITGSGRDVKNFSSFCEGDIEPTSNKMIYSLIDARDEYIIYLDDEFYVQWSYLNSYDKKVPKSFGAVADRVGHLETLSRSQLRPSQYEHFARVLAEAMARVIADADERHAVELLSRATAYLQLRGTENARYWYIRGSSLTAIPFLLAMIVFWSCRSSLTQFLGAGAFDIALGSFVGALGALLSILTRSEKIPMDPAAGPFIHYLESGSRILAGSLGALLLALAIKSNMLLGIFKSGEYSFAVLLALCFVAGTSERFVSGLVKKIESTASSGQKHDPDAA